MSEALLIMALGLVLAVGFTVGLIRRRRFREAGPDPLHVYGVDPSSRTDHT